MASIELVGLHKSFGPTSVVRDLSLRLETGGLLALLGPSGCGKTTTLRMIAGLEHPDAGDIRIDEVRVNELPVERRGLGMVFQSYAVWPNRTVAENIAYPLRLQRRPRAEIAERVNQALDWVRLTSLAGRLPQQLSGGQLQRVALARALVANPKVLLLDEPLSNLDVALRDELRGELAALRARLGTTMILVTHDQAEALALATTMAVMRDGRIEQFGSPATIFNAPTTAFVAAFVGQANVIRGRADNGRFITQNHAFDLPQSLRHVSGQGTLAVRAEHVSLVDGGTPLARTAMLFAGDHFEHRFALEGGTLRAFTQASAHSEASAVKFNDARFFAD